MYQNVAGITTLKYYDVSFLSFNHAEEAEPAAGAGRAARGRAAGERAPTARTPCPGLINRADGRVGAPRPPGFVHFRACVIVFGRNVWRGHALFADAAGGGTAPCFFSLFAEEACCVRGPLPGLCQHFNVNKPL
ncbi:hypothetical protein EVAR_58158_1 [Eumeta japonica]|uniref:Uncharacterized protein n=1 Tax=Eumeta variegata TaxID=151549 RepID=A0A4C1X2X8_EUMVA|nr:hypothetical protein EVAR_58158_1 [Eumeta japonica]